MRNAEQSFKTIYDLYMLFDNVFYIWSELIYHSKCNPLLIQYGICQRKVYVYMYIIYSINYTGYAVRWLKYK